MIKYTAPEMEVVAIDTEDIILASTGNDGNGEGGLPDDNF